MNNDNDDNDDGSWLEIIVMVRVIFYRKRQPSFYGLLRDIISSWTGKEKLPTP